jgi:hypothetical protein
MAKSCVPASEQCFDGHNNAGGIIPLHEMAALLQMDRTAIIGKM